MDQRAFFYLLTAHQNAHRGPVDLKHGFYSENKSSRVGMIVKGYGYRSEGGNDGSFPETL